MAARKKTAEKPRHIPRWRRGVRIPSGVDKDAAMTSIIDYSKRHIPAEDVLDEIAEDTTHALHNWLDWDDGHAAHQHRLSQVRSMLRSVEFVIEYEPEKEIVVNVMTSVNDKDTGKRVYTNTIDAMNDPNYREQILQQALVELKRFQSKYRSLSELAQVMDAAGKILRQNTVRARARKAKSGRRAS